VKTVTGILSGLSLSDRGKELLPDFLEFIQAPEKPKGLLGVVEVFLLHLKDQDFREFPKEAEAYREIAKEIHEKRAVITGSYPELAARRHEVPKHVLHGTIKNHPVYALLYYKTKTNSLTLIRLQKALISGIYNPAENSKPIKPADVTKYSLAIRQLADLEQGQAWLNYHDESPPTSLSGVQVILSQFSSDVENADFKLDIEDKDEIEKVEHLRTNIKNAHTFIDAVIGRHVIRRKFSNKKVFKYRSKLAIRGKGYINDSEFCEIRVLGDVDDPGEHPEVHAIVKVQNNKEIKKELEEFGLEPEEVQELFEFIFVRYKNIPAYAQAFSDALRSRGTSKRMELQNQYLPLSTQLLNDSELIQLSKLISSQFKTGCSRVEMKSGLLMSCMFATSTPYEIARDLQIVNQQSEFLSGEESIGYDKEKREWLMQVYPLDLKTEVDSDALNDSRNTEAEFISLPDVFGFHKRLKRVFGENIPKRPFLRSGIAEPNIKAILRKCNDRLTLSRLERYLSLRVAGKYEPTQATYLFNNYLSASSARRYYTALASTHYSDIYSEVCWGILNQLGRSFKVPLESNDESDQFIGARYCPKTDHIKKVISSMQADLIETQKAISEKEDNWVRLHNLYTTYSVYVQGLLTGIRAIVSPFIGPDEIIRELNIAVCRDKDTEDQFHTRNIPLHPLVLRLIEQYESHREAVLVRLSAINPVAAQEMKLSKDAPFIFLIDEKYNCKHVRPSQLKPYLSRYTKLPLNSNRKYLRNTMLESGISMHAIDTLLGHASRGEPFWNTCATIDFSSLATEVITALDNIAKDIGIAPKHGLAV